MDFALVPRRSKVFISVIETILSDHNAVKLTVSVPQLEKKKGIKILDRDLASRGTLRTIRESENSLDFLQFIHKYRKRNKHKIYKTLKKSQVERKLFLSLVKEKEEETKVILTKYWEELIEGNERLRYSVYCKEAFQFLRRVFKYNQFERRDGSIVDSAA